MFRLVTLAILLAGLGVRGVSAPVQRFDVFELNTYDENGFIFQHLICWEWVEADKALRVRYAFSGAAESLEPIRLSGRWRFYYDGQHYVEAAEFRRSRTGVALQYLDRFWLGLPDRWRVIPLPPIDLDI